MKTKICTRCKKNIDINLYTKDRSSKSGVRSYCKNCAKILFNNWQDNGGRKKVQLNNNRSYHKHKNTIEYRYLRLKTGAKQRNKELQITLDQFKELWDQKCFYCNDIVTTAGLDRIDSSKGYVLGNVVRCCELCNRAKNILSVEDFISHCYKIIKHYESS